MQWLFRNFNTPVRADHNTHPAAGAGAVSYAGGLKSALIITAVRPQDFTRADIHAQHTPFASYAVNGNFNHADCVSPVFYCFRARRESARLFPAPSIRIAPAIPDACHAE